MKPACVARLCRTCATPCSLAVRCTKPKSNAWRCAGISPGSRPLVLWRNRGLAARRMKPPGDRNPPDVVEFCRVFPDAYAISERPGYFEGKNGSKGRLLSAGFHLMQGYFRDDAPLYELVLDDAERREIDELWHDLNFVTNVPAHQYRTSSSSNAASLRDFMIDAAFDFARSEDKDSASEAKIERLRAAYLAKARRNEAKPEAIAAIETFFLEINAAIRACRTRSRPMPNEAISTPSSCSRRAPIADRSCRLNAPRRSRSIKACGATTA